MADLTKVGVIGAGSFGTAIANLLSLNTKVLLVTTNEAASKLVNATRKSAGQNLHPEITVTHDLKRLGNECQIIFPIIPSQEFLNVW